MCKGFVAITTVLILSFIVIAISATITLLSIGEAQSALVLYQGEDNLNFAEGCVEDALLKIRSNPGYTSGTINHPQGTCVITVNTKDPWSITVNSQTTTYQRLVQVQFTRTATGITLTSWREI